MKKIILLLLGFYSIQCFSQQSNVLATRDGVEISYQLTNLSKGDKKDKYLIVISAVNNSFQDLFYAVPVFKDAAGAETFGLTPQLGFSNIQIRNSTGWFGDGKEVAGEQTILRTEDGGNLFMMTKGKVLSFEFEFNTKSGVEPIITNSYTKSLRALTDFNIAINEAIINGTWVSSCGNSLNTLTLMADSLGVTYISQSVNGRQFKWLRRSSLEFTKENDPNSTLTYNKATNTFLYSNAEGITCDLTKK